MNINDQSDILPGDYVVIEEDGHPIAGVTWDEEGNLMLGARVIRWKDGFVLRAGLVFLTATRDTSTRPTPDEVREQARNAHDPDPDFEVLPEVEVEDETESPWVTVSISGDPEIVREMLLGGIPARSADARRPAHDLRSDLDNLNTRREGL